MLKEVWSNPWVRLATASAALAALVLLVVALRPVLVPLLFAFIVAYIFNPVVNALGRHNVPRGRAALLVVAVLLTIVFLLPLLLIPNIAVEAETMVREARQERQLRKQASPGEELNFAERWVNAGLDRLPLGRLVTALGWAESQPPGIQAREDHPTDLEASESEAPSTIPTHSGTAAPAAQAHPAPFPIDSQGQGTLPQDAQQHTAAPETPVPEGELLPPAAPGLTNAEAREILRERIALWIHENAAQYLRAHASLLANAGKWAGTSIADLIGGLINALVGVLLFIGNFVLFTVVTIYLMRDYEIILHGGNELIPPRNRTKAAEILAKIDLQLRSFLRGQFLVCCCLGTMYAIGFLISGVPFGLTLAIFGGLAAFIPFIGIVLTMLPVAVLTLVEHGVDWHIAGVALTFGLAQFLEGNFLTPRIVGSQVGLGPVWVILSVMVFSTLFGFVGILIAVPIAAILKVLVLEALQLYRASHLFQDPQPSP